MNEIKHIHLGRQAFTVSLEAHRELRAYLDEIRHEAGRNGADVVEEVELRVAELLNERGIAGDTVVLPKDITRLKEQLGTPRDFREDADDDGDASAPAGDGERRLFRDPEHGMVAGVAAGLAAYFRIDPVIVRIVFVALIFASGAGFIVYGLLWLLLPPAQTASERLQMQGKPVNVGTLKELVERADVAGATRRSVTAVERVAAVCARVLFGSIGVLMVCTAALALLAVLAASCYVAVHHGAVAGTAIFPVGVVEVWSLVLAVLAAGSFLTLLIVFGTGLVSNRWRMVGRVMAVLAGIFFIAGTITLTLLADRIPSIAQRIESLRHTEVRTLQPFTSAALTGEDTRFIFVPDRTYEIEYRSVGAADVSKAQVRVDHGKLSINTGTLARHQLCTGLCFYPEPDLQVYIHAPRLDTVSVQGDGTVFASEKMLDQPQVDRSVGPGVPAMRPSRP